MKPPTISRKTRPLKALWLISFSIALGYLAWQYPSLNPRVATKFDLSGNPTQVVTRFQFLFWNLVLLFGMNAFFYLLTTPLQRKLPVFLINIPWKRHWMALENREEGYAVISQVLCFAGIFYSWVVLLIDHAIVQTSNPNPMPHLSVNATVYTIFGLTVFLLFFIRWFTQPPEANE